MSMLWLPRSFVSFQALNTGKSTHKSTTNTHARQCIFRLLYNICHNRYFNRIIFYTTIDRKFFVYDDLLYHDERQAKDFPLGNASLFY